MNNKMIMLKFIRSIKKRRLLTLFINEIFNPEIIHDCNYLFRIEEIDDKIIIDIYDNVSSNRFSRYIYNFSSQKINIKDQKKKDVHVTIINVKYVHKPRNNITKLGYIFNLDNNKMIKYANKFMNEKFVNILANVIKKPISK